MAAEAWGTPPWEIVNQPGGAVWLGRLRTLREVQAFVAQSDGVPTEDFEAV